MDSVLPYVDQLAQESRKSEAEVMALAFQTGVRQLWREHLLGRYLRGELSRQEIIEAVGIDWVDLAERQHQAMLEDVAWARQD